MDEQAVLTEALRAFRAGRADRAHGVRVGVGDDAALLRIGRSDVAITVDSVVEGVDFDLRYFRWSDVGYKAVSAAVSDLYACGARPNALLISAGIPRGATRSRIRALLGGIREAARLYSASVVGGDTTVSPKLFVDVCALGELDGKFKSRSGARPGDRIFLSGFVGSSRAALLSIRRDLGITPSLRRSHCRPIAARAAAGVLSGSRNVTAMMDVSDGLLIDLSRMCRSSGVIAGIHPSRVPVTAAAIAAFQRMGRDPIAEAMVGGEDYVLLFTVRPPIPDVVRRRFHHIGEMLKSGPGGHIYNMERCPPLRMRVKGFLHRF